MTKSNWKWYGTAGHLCVADSCLFHLLTDVGNYIVSTIGDYRPRYKHDGNESLPEPQEIGYKRLFETYVFKYSGGFCECGCGTPKPADLSEVDALPANTYEEANTNHLKLCQKWSRKVPRKKEQSNKMV